MINTALIRATKHPAVAAACVLLACCAPYPTPVQAVQPIPPGPTADELANYAAAQIQYRYGIITGDHDAIAEANESFRQISGEIFSRQDPKGFEAEVVCERYRVAGPSAAGRNVLPPFEAQCRNIGWRYNEATDAIREDLQARIAAADLATIAQAGVARP